MSNAAHKPTPDDQSEALSDLVWTSLDVPAGSHEIYDLAEVWNRDREQALRIAEASAPKTAEVAK